MKCPKQALPVQRPSTSAAISNQKGVKPSNNAFEEILNTYIMSDESGASGWEHVTY
ncbi:hypothetical protein [Moorena sp. SIO3H5]|uniref:hypothetical protein n=1 Tax=Moorena sp. SIO3H5 TaxID=2607834 RepID=UPI0013B5FB75|nr:hypothetical protein [Moorena sp. SIO3H5]NEO73043.1 hypothetical protein [Moorena sp. SIO3H5]